jgi:hypothetical protein
MTAETKHLIVLKIIEEHCVQIKNTYYSCLCLTCMFSYFNKVNLIFFIS